MAPIQQRASTQPRRVSHADLTCGQGRAGCAARHRAGCGGTGAKERSAVCKGPSSRLSSGGLDLELKHVVNFACVRADCPCRIACPQWAWTNLCDDGSPSEAFFSPNTAFSWSRPRRRQPSTVVGMLPSLAAPNPLGESPIVLVCVPIAGFGQKKASGGSQAECTDVGAEDQQASQLLPWYARRVRKVCTTPNCEACLQGHSSLTIA